MSKAKLYKIEKNSKKDTESFIVDIFIYAVVLFIASNLFKCFYISNFLYAFIAALILSALNYTIKPILVYLTLTLTILTFGIAYPIVNMIILKICDILMGKEFVISGFLPMFFIAIFISFLKITFDNIFINKY